MKNLNKQAQKLGKILKGKGISFESITPKIGLIEVVLQDGNICYYTLDLKRSTIWSNYKSIVLENGFVKLTHQDEDVCYYTPDLKHSTPWGDYDSIAIKNGVIEVSSKTKYSFTFEKL